MKLTQYQEIVLGRQQQLLQWRETVLNYIFRKKIDFLLKVLIGFAVVMATMCMM